MGSWVQIPARLKTAQPLWAPPFGCLTTFVVTRDLLYSSWHECGSAFSIPPLEVVGESSESPKWLSRLIGLLHFWFICVCTEYLCFTDCGFVSLLISKGGKTPIFWEFGLKIENLLVKPLVKNFKAVIFRCIFFSTVCQILLAKAWPKCHTMHEKRQWSNLCQLLCRTLTFVQLGG